MTRTPRNAALAASAFLMLSAPSTLQANEKLGDVDFPISCSAGAQAQFNRAVAMLHSFFFPETVKAFKALVGEEPSCAMAHWGLAISQRPNPLVPPFPEESMKNGWAAIEAARAAGPKTQRERDWIEALAAFYQDYDKLDLRTRTLRYEAAMAGLSERYPGDNEAAIFYALALNEAVDLKDKSYARQLKAAAILQDLEPKLPNHPGIPHYIIHSYDFAPICGKGLPAAQRYGELAPAAPHALHMPSHIFSMLGMWDESIAANVRTVAAAEDYARRNNIDGVLANVPHSYDFMQYAYLQLGQDDKARTLVEQSASIRKVVGSLLETGLSAVPARYVLERQDWHGAAALVMPSAVKAPPARAIIHFARAMGAARLGDSAAARTEIGNLQELKAMLEQGNQAYWAGQVKVQILAAQAWLTQGEGDGMEAIKLMRDAAELEDASEKHVAMENRLYPMRELLGDLLLTQGQPAAALVQYEAALKSTPERLRGYYGAGRAASEIGDSQRAARYFRSLTRLTEHAASDRAEIREAKAFLALH